MVKVCLYKCSYLRRDLIQKILVHHFLSYSIQNNKEPANRVHSVLRQFRGQFKQRSFHSSLAPVLNTTLIQGNWITDFAD